MISVHDCQGEKPKINIDSSWIFCVLLLLLTSWKELDLRRCSCAAFKGIKTVVTHVQFHNCICQHPCRQVQLLLVLRQIWMNSFSSRLGRGLSWCNRIFGCWPSMIFSDTQLVELHFARKRAHSSSILINKNCIHILGQILQCTNSCHSCFWWLCFRSWAGAERPLSFDGRSWERERERERE